MATPVSPEDKRRVERSFDEEAGPVRTPHLLHPTTLSPFNSSLIQTDFFCLLTGRPAECQGTHGAVQLRLDSALLPLRLWAFMH